MSALLLRICSWCDIVIVDGPPDAPVSHGICERCFKRWIEEDEKS